MAIASNGDAQRPPRPLELFHNKLLPALKSRGVEDASSRKNWPKEVLLEVFQQLQSETPNTLLARELWGSAPDTRSWWNRQLNFTRSTAVMSMLGYTIGLGDRHLDNLLLAPDGHFFHVDFGYILNRDPKPFAPAVKLSKEMVDAMGGTNSPHYTRFKKFSFTAFVGRTFFVPRLEITTPDTVTSG